MSELVSAPAGEYVSEARNAMGALGALGPGRKPARMLIKPKSRPLLTASLGVATASVVGCGGCTGNLMPPPPLCRAPLFVNYDRTCVERCPPGTEVDAYGYEGPTCVIIPYTGSDAGTNTTDAGSDAGVDASTDGAADASGDATVDDAGSD